MKLGKFIVFIHRKLTGDLNAEETPVQPDWSGEEHADVERQVGKIWSASKSYKSNYQPDIDRSWDSFSAKLAAEKKQAPGLRVLRQRFAFAATVLLLILAGTFWWKSVHRNDTLQFVTTAGNETRLITLPDETIVTLNQNSRLSFKRHWKNDIERRVQFSGEAYFEIKPNAQKPFRIETDQTEVQVLGTAFNLRAYPDENYTEVAVTEGQVQFSGKQAKANTILLIKDQVGRLDHRKNKVNPIRHSAFNKQFWRTKELSFRNAPMLEIAEAMEREFDVDMRFANVEISQCLYNFNYAGESLEEMLKIFQLSLRLDIQQTGKNAYLISGGNCDTSH